MPERTIRLSGLLLLCALCVIADNSGVKETRFLKIDNITAASQSVVQARSNLECAAFCSMDASCMSYKFENGNCWSSTQGGNVYNRVDGSEKSTASATVTITTTAITTPATQITETTTAGTTPLVATTTMTTTATATTTTPEGTTTTTAETTTATSTTTTSTTTTKTTATSTTTPETTITTTTTTATTTTTTTATTTTATTTTMATTTQMTTTLSTNPPCPTSNGYQIRMISSQSYCIKHENMLTDRATAKLDCELHEAHLLVIENQAIFNDVDTLLEETGSIRNDFVWIDGDEGDGNTEQVKIWNGDPIPWISWAPTEPTFSKTKRDCIMYKIEGMAAVDCGSYTNNGKLYICQLW